MIRCQRPVAGLSHLPRPRPAGPLVLLALVVLLAASQGPVQPWVPPGTQAANSRGISGGSGSGWAPRMAAALPESAAFIVYPAMEGYDSPSLPGWNLILKDGKKVYTPGPGRRATNGSVFAGQHLGGVYDHLVYEHLRSGCEGVAPGKPCKRKVCALSRGDWCKEYYNQDPVPWRPPPRGDKDCPSTQHGACNGVGSCQHDIGICLCPAGWRGPDCGTRDLRPCTHRMRHGMFDGANTAPVSHVGPDGRDRNWSVPGWTASRCAGYCDEEVAMCYCPPGTKHGREPPPAGSPPGTPPIKAGRPMGDSCKPNRDPALKDGPRTEWGGVDPDHLFGPKGWCNADENPQHHCGCILDGSNGAFCEVPSEAFCFNQCSGRGDCMMGFCKCHEGWYGMDCSRQRASAKEKKKADHEPGGSKPYLEGVVLDPPAAQDPPPSPTRRRPLIYVYDTDPAFNTRMMQYRIAKSSCVYRLFGQVNDTNFNSYVYALETYWIEMLTVSQHRTYDPEEADFFFVPVQLTCYLWPVLGWADHPWFGMPAAHSRAQQGTFMYLKAKRWVQEHYPFWDRRGGRDHIFMMLNDEGACWMPQEVYNTSIVLSHWGRMDQVHVSGTAWGYDNYSAPLEPWAPYVEGDWRKEYDGHPCYTPGKDLIIPSLKPPSHYSASPLLGAPPFDRDILLYLRGDTGPYRAHWYSRGIRQRLAKLSYQHDWAEKHRIYVGEGWQISGSYSEHLARSVFCVVAPGDGWSARAEDAILHGCIPLVIMEGVHQVFESILEWDAFAIRIREEAVNEDLPKFLRAISPEQVERMQRRLAVVWHRFAYATGSLLASQLQGVYTQNRAVRRAAHRPAAALADTATAASAKAMGAAMGHRGLVAPQGSEEASSGGEAAAAAAGTVGGGAEDGGHGTDWLGPLGHPYTPYSRFPLRSDAWNTIMGWLFSRIADTRKP